MSRLRQEVVNFAFIAVGVAAAGMGLHGFLLTANLIDGGVTGISMLLAQGLGAPLWLLLPIINLPFVAVGYRQLGRSFAVRSAIAIGALAVTLALVHFPEVTTDRVLTAAFGGMLLGGGIGLAMRGGAVLDGTEIAALLISKRSGTFRVGDVILTLNVIIFGVAIFVLGIEEALYSILTYAAASRTLHFILHGIEEYTAVTIVSPEHQRIRQRLTNELGRGVTVYKGEGGASGTEQNILYCVVTRLEIAKVKRVVREVDRSAFFVTHALSDAEGGMVKRVGVR